MVHIPTEKEYQNTLALTVKAMKSAALHKARKERQERESKRLYRETIINFGTTSKATQVSWMDRVNSFRANEAMLLTCSEGNWFGTWIDMKRVEKLIESANERGITIIREIKMLRI